MSTRLATLKHVLDIMEIPDEIQEAMKDISVRSIGSLNNLSHEELMAVDDMKVGHVQALLMFKVWFGKYVKEYDGIPTDWITTFTEEIWEEFLLLESVKVKTAPTVTTVNSSVNQATSSKLPQVKIDIRSYPEFNGKLKEWRVFKKQFISVASMHGIANIMNNDYKIPTDQDELMIFNQKNTFLQSILEHSLAKGTALSRVVKHSKKCNGIGSWVELVQWFEGQGSYETIAKEALTVLMTHKLTPNSHGGADKFMEKFEGALQELIDIERPYDHGMAKINFLTNIEDPDYRITKETLEMDDSKSYNDCLIEIRRRSILIDKAKKNVGIRRSNKSKRKSNNLKKKMGEHWIEPEKWRAMSQSEKSDHLKKVRASKDSNSPNKDGGALPKQYSSANKMTAGEKELFDMMQTPSTQSTTSSITQEEDDLTPQQLKFMNMVRSLKMVRTTRASLAQEFIPTKCEGGPLYHQGRMLNSVQSLRSVNRSKSSSKSMSEGEVLVDGGCDTSLVGQGFVVESTTSRTVSVQGFQEGLTLEELPIVTAVTAIDLPDGTFIIEMGEAIHIPSNETSLLSTFQAREHGVIVNDVAKRHNGQQNIIADDVEIPLNVVQKLLSFKIREPTKSERRNCPRITLTSDLLWDIDNDDEIDAMTLKVDMESVHTNVREFIPEGSFHTEVLRTCATRSSVLPQDLKLLQPKMGWMPLSTLFKTLEVTTQLAKNTLQLPMRRHVKSRFPQLNRNRLREPYATDTIFSSVSAVDTGHTCMQVFTAKKSKYCVGYGMRTESGGVDALERFIADVGAPYHMMNDNVKMETSDAWKKILTKYNISRSTTEPYHPQQNPAERRIQDIKRYSLNIMDHTGAPESLWELAILYIMTLLNHTANKSLSWKTPLEKAFGITPDISALTQFAFYEPIYVLDTEESFPHSREIAGRFVGIADNMGDALTYKVLTENNSVIGRSVIRSALDPSSINLRVSAPGDRRDQYLQSSQFSNEVTIFSQQNIHREWDGEIVNKDHDAQPATSPNNTSNVDRSDSENGGSNDVVNTNSELLQSTQDITGNKTLPTIEPDKLIGFNFVMKNKDSVPEKAKVVDWTKEGKFIIEFLNGGRELMTYNDLINHYDQVNEENAEMYAFKKITGHRKEGRSWQVKVLWDTDEETWEHMQSIKESDPLTLAKYAHDNHLIDDKGLKWTRRYTKDPKKFINLIRLFVAQRKYSSRKYKFGVEIPRNFRHALLLDEQNRNTLWGDATDKEVDELMQHKTFKIVDKLDDVPNGYKFVPLQFVYDNKFDGRRKGRLVACGNFTNPDTADIYSGVVSIESVRILFTLADVNNLKVIAADVCNAYLNGKTREKLYSQLDYGKLKGKYLIIDKALYGLKTSAARWADAISETLYLLGFRASYADTEIWMRKNSDRYDYIAVYVDDLIIAARDPMNIIKELEQVGKYTFKGVGVPEYYLGGDVSLKKNNEGKSQIVLSSKTYIMNVCDKIERLFNLRLRNYHSPLEGGYHPELDQSEFLTGDDISKYRMLVGSLNWAVTIGRVDVMFAAITMARYNQAPRKGHLQVMFRIFGYLKNHLKANLKIDTSDPEEPADDVVKCDWKHLYPNACEKIPKSFPVALGVALRLWAQFDADNAHDLETRRSVTGVFVYLNNTLIKWYSKRQHTVETSTYGSEIVACKIGVEILIEMRYTLRMMGVPLLNETWLFGDNLSVITNCSKPESTLKKKHHSCAYHFIREAVSMGWLFLFHIPSEKNRADILTKALNPSVLYGKVKGWLF